MCGQRQAVEVINAVFCLWPLAFYDRLSIAISLFLDVLS